MLLHATVSDALLRKLSRETAHVGKKVTVPGSKTRAGYEAIIVNVIIFPLSEFYQNQFFTFYRFFNQNAVKALKEMAQHFPYTPDYRLDVGYVLDTCSPPFGSNEIRSREEFDLAVVMEAV